MTEVYVFNDDGYYFSNGCDCCEDLYMECYNCTSHILNGSQHRVEDCYIEALRDAGVFDENDDSVYDWFLEQLKSICVNNDIKVVFCD